MAQADDGKNIQVSYTDERKIENKDTSNCKRKKIMQNISAKKRKFPKELMCHICDVVLASNQSLSKHISSIHEEKK